MSYTIIDDINIEQSAQPKKQGMLMPNNQMSSPQNPYVRTVHDNFNNSGSNPIINRMMNAQPQPSQPSPYPLQNHSQKVREMINTPLPQHNGLVINRAQYGVQGQPLFQHVPQRNIRTNVTPTISLFVNQQQDATDNIDKKMKHTYNQKMLKQIKKNYEEDDDEDNEKDDKYEMYEKPHRKQKQGTRQEQEESNDVIFQIQHMSTIFRNHIEKINDNVLFLQEKVENLATMMKFLFVIIIVLFIMFLRK